MCQRFCGRSRAVEQIEYMGPRARPVEGATRARVECSTVTGALSRPGVGGPDWTLPRKRFDYIHSLEAAQSASRMGLVPEKVGLLPYQSTEVWDVESAMRELFVHQKRPQEHPSSRALVIFYAGWWVIMLATDRSLCM